MSTKKKKKRKERIEVGHLMTKVVVGFLCEGVGKGDTPPKLMRYHLPLACCFCQGCRARAAERLTKSTDVLSLITVLLSKHVRL